MIAVLSGAVLSIIGTTLITSLVWCCAVSKFKRKINAKNQKDLNNIKQHAELTQSSKGTISTGENLAYGQVADMPIYEDINLSDKEY